MYDLYSTVGTIENPLKLKNQHQDTELSKKFAAKSKLYIHRPLLQKCTKNNNGEDGFAFDKAHEDRASYVANILSNPNLTPIEIKVAIAIHNILEGSWDGNVFICTSNKLNIENCGEDGLIYIGKNGDWALLEETPLHQLLLKIYGIKISTDVLNRTLARLDSFHYINLTAVIPENGHIECKQRSIKPRAYFKHIALNEMMAYKNLVNTWVKVK